MKYLGLLTIFTAMFMSGCGNNRTYMGYDIIDMPFQISGGQTLLLPMTDAGPIPAEDDSFKIEVAGLLTGPSSEDPSKAVIIWSFSLTSKKSEELKSVYIEQVSPNTETISLVTDESPLLKNRSWSGRALPTIMSKQSTPWLYENGDSTFVFKIRINTEEGNTVTLYQPSRISDQSKVLFRDLASE